MVQQLNSVTLRKIKKEDLEVIWQMGCREANPEWKKWDAPYFPHEVMSFEQFKQEEASWYLSDKVRAICVDKQIIGIVSKVWIDANTRWLEVGIIIYPVNYWSHGYGTSALRLWLDEVFSTTEQLEHIGLTTWSGNIRMMKAAEKLGMTQEAVIRKVRFYNDTYYDSVKYGILRDEWE